MTFPGFLSNFSRWVVKVDNCQVGVFASLTNGVNAALIGARLLLPEEWASDNARSLRAGVPDDQIRAASKIDLAREIIEEAGSNGVEYARVGLDSFYGRDLDLLCWLEDRGGEFYADIPSNTYVWLTKPNGVTRPTSPSKHGAVKASELAGQPTVWRKSKRIKIREGENGPVVVTHMACRIGVWNAGEKVSRQWRLLVSKDKGGEIKYTLSNATVDTLQEDLARHQGQRHFIERNSQNSKSHLGMAQYQVRKWSGWHRHMAMVALAGLFVMEERLLNREVHPLLSTRDVVQILDWYFRDSPTLDDIIGQIDQRHKRRRRAANFKA